MSSSSSSSTSLEPTLYALLPPPLFPKFTSHLSLHSIHIEPLQNIDRIYVNSNPIVKGQLRNLRFRSRKLPPNSTFEGQSKGKEKDKGDGRWVRSLSYVSAPLRGQEYGEITTRAVIGLDILGLEDEEETEEFIGSLGFEHSHTYLSSGQLFHIPLPLSLPTPTPLTLHLSLTHISPSPPKDQHQNQSGKENQPWLVQLSPSRPVNAVSINGDLAYSNLVEYMRDFVDSLGIRGLDWTVVGR
ncbi:hypothetical protein I302_101443 [Kwoniella bestiolae CBS 10118]|uniref:Mediator complex subunit 18 n=1 Tax=Kwoniella bestiolae CBS 10118 TaxID=1296100 RepID=A0A1B9GCA8_9TREE|nr:hypothetical protein I302_00127 [Kwoniella bestiolae CBS 10118]OCF28638.1 hypothetical protein I302_00127 [Kwoniella bestiolae CBS 10118]